MQTREVNSVLDLLDQEEFWFTGNEVIKISDMDRRHRLNSAAWMVKRADPLHHLYVEHMVFGGPIPRGDAAIDCFEAALDEVLDASPEDWIKESLLYA